MPQIMASQHLTRAGAEDNHSVRVLCHQGLVEPTSNLQPRRARSLLGRVWRLRIIHVRAPLPIFESEAPNVIADIDDDGSGHFRLASNYSSSVADATHTPVKVCSVRGNRLDRHKKEPRTAHAVGDPAAVGP